ncbi:MAG TPA: Uma2 family endonuclease [Polyangiaceae bacterium]
MTSAADGPEIPVVPPGEHELPCSDGEPMETNRHRQQMVLLIQSLKRAWADRHDYFAGGNMFVYYSETQVKKNDFRGPDVFVVLDTTDRDRLSWVAWGEDGKLPNVVIELLSDRTRHIDKGEKVQIYARWRVSTYILYDPLSHELMGFEFVGSAREFTPIEPDERGDLRCPILGFKVGLREGNYEGVHTQWLRWLDADGNPLPTTEEQAEAEHARAEAEHARAEAEHARAEAEHARAEAAEQRAAELEAKLRGG